MAAQHSRHSAASEAAALSYGRPMNPRLQAVAVAAATSVLTNAHANHPAAPTAAPQTVIVTGNYDNAVGNFDAASAGTARRELVQSRPVLRAAEVLEFVPGVIVTQHSGDGKANQYFLRGFNLDHGTDFATRVEGMPVNMPSHGHGQGYSDLNFIIPELIDRIDYRKGPYQARDGDFAAAGAADIRLVSRLAAPFAQITLGQDGYRRGVGAGSYTLGETTQLLAGVEVARNNGPWTVPERLRKTSGVLALTGGTRSAGWNLALMGYDSRWTSTDQVPQRLVDAGSFNGAPFGSYDSLDPSTGGGSTRTSLSAEWHDETAAGKRSISAYLIGYRLDLHSNFTYALERPDDGDQFKQRDRRRVAGLDARQALDHTLAGLASTTTVGLQLRHDRITNGLFDSIERRITTTVREDRIRQTHSALYASSALELSATWRAVLGLRADHVAARVDALTLPANGGRASDTQLSPKLTLVWAAGPRTELYFNAGRGLHSNDARGMTSRIDPRSGDPLDPVPPLVALDGAEIGIRTQALPGLQSSVVLWGLRSQSELVYVGDAGNTEASQASRRRGVEISNRWQALPWLWLDADLAFNHARLADGSRIPNAVDRVGQFGITVRESDQTAGFSGSLQWRYLGSGALIEDNSIRSRPASTLNLRVSRSLGKAAALTLDVFNLTDREVDDIQYAYESQLPGEAEPVLDRHVHPAEPRRIRLTLQARF
jgi:outer membrane cobalamin receptor